MTCGEHGAETWRATVVCTNCDRAWWLQDHAPEHEKPKAVGLVCDCGAGLKALGRAICWRCYCVIRQPAPAASVAS